MKKVFLVAMTIVGSQVRADDLSVHELRERLELRADMYQTDASGTRILSGPGRTNYWRPSAESKRLRGNWSSSFDGNRIAFLYSLDVLDDGTMKMSIKEYNDPKGKESDPDFDQVIGEKEFIVKNLEPVVWQVKNVKDKHFVVRFVPSLREEIQAVSLGDLPVAGTGVSISDNQGYHWAEDVTFSGKYSGFTSHRGTIVISYVPFKGAREMGTVEGEKIILNVDKNLQVRMKSATSFVPSGVVAKVYAVYLPQKKSKRINSLHSFDSNREDRALEMLKR